MAIPMVWVWLTLFVTIMQGCESLESVLYPFGDAAGDSTRCEYSGGYDAIFKLSKQLVFFGKKYNTVIGDYEGMTFKKDTKREAYADIYSGSSFECEDYFVRESTDTALLSQGTQDVREAFSRCHHDFRPKRIVVVTWNKTLSSGFDDYGWLDCMLEHGNADYCHCVDVKDDDYFCACAYIDRKNYYWCLCTEFWYNTDEYCLDNGYTYSKGETYTSEWVYEGYEGENRHQIVLLYNRYDTYIMFNYAQLQWYKYDEDEIPHMRLNGPYRGSDRSSLEYVHPFSHTADIMRLATESNVGKPGRWMYKVSEKDRFIGPDCRKLHV